jgi:hypothetical protein
VTDADRHGTSWKGLAIRGAHLLSGFVYAGLTLSAIGIVLGTSGGGEDAAAQDWTAWLLSQPFGRWLVGLAGVVIAGTGLGFLLKAWRGDVTRHLACDARGVVFLIIGGFLGLAALHSSSSEAIGLGGALQTVAAQPHGWVLLALMAVGLFAFGVFGIVQALYRRIDAPDLDDAKAAAREGIGSLTG